MEIEFYCGTCNQTFEINPADVMTAPGKLSIGIPAHGCPGHLPGEPPVSIRLDKD